MALSAVVTTGIHCRPGRPGRPDPSNVVAYDNAAAAEAAGFRACLRGRTYRTRGAAGSTGPAGVCGAARLVAAGALGGTTEDALAARVGPPW